MIQKIAFYTFSNIISALEYYRVYGPLEYAGVQIINGVQQGKINLEIIQDCDMVLFQRDFARHFDEYQTVVDRARDLQKAIVLDLDDDLLSLPSDHPDRITNYYADSLLPILHAIINADGVTVTTEPLKETIQKMNPNVWVLPNYLDEQLWMMRSFVPNTIEQPLTILYMGSHTHRPDLDMISKPLVQIAKLYGDKIRFHFLGVEPPTDLEGFSQVTHQPALTFDYHEFVTQLENVHADIAIAPLYENDFNRSKSALKFFEYSAMGIPAVYSDMLPYSKVIRDGYEGLLAATPEQWFEKIQLLIQRPDLRHEIVQNAQTSIRQNWRLSDHAVDWKAAYAQIKPSMAGNQVDRTELLGYLAKIIVQLGEQKSQVDGKLYRLGQVAEAWQTEQDQLQENLQSLNSKLEEITETYQGERKAWQTERYQLKKNLQSLNTALVDTQIELVNYPLSTSWKVTRPLRWISKKLRG